MLEFSIFISSQSKNIVKDNSEYLGIFYLLKLIFQTVEMAKVLWYNPSQDCHHGKVYPRRHKPGALPGYAIPKRPYFYHILVSGNISLA
jgi:hypothetical protein